MGNFEPSGNFVNAVMRDVRKYELETRSASEHIRTIMFSRPVVLTLSTVGMLFGIFNFLRMALILISPALCF
jgi:hypothetical protein